MIRFPTAKQPRHAHSPVWWSRLRPVLVVLGVIFVILTTLYGLKDNADRNRQSREIRNSQKCQQELNSLNASRNLALTKIQNDDRHAVDKWIARVNVDIQTGQFKDLAVAYGAYRAERLTNERKRAKYGAGIKIKSNVCEFEIVPVSHGPLPTASVDLTVAPPVLPTLPPARTVTRTGPGGATATVTITRHAASTRTVTRLEIRTKVQTVESTVTVSAKPSCALIVVC